MKTRLSLAAAIAILAGAAHAQPVQTPAPAANFVLSCKGRATFTIPNLDWDKAKQSYGDDRRVDTAGQIGLKVQDGQVKVRFPSGVPGGGQWRDANRVEITPGSISGRIAGSRFAVDRRTGDIEVSGALAFSGACEKAPDESAPTKF